MGLNARQEAFCQAYAQSASGAAAARDAGYGLSNPAGQAARLLKKPEIAARIAELAAPLLERQVDLAAEREAAARDLSDKLMPVYQASLDDGDYDGVMQVIELQARVRNLLTGGSTIRARGPRPPSKPGQEDAVVGDAELRQLQDRFIDHDCTLEAVRRALERIEQFLDPTCEHNLLRRYHRDESKDDEWFLRPDFEVDDEGYYDPATRPDLARNEKDGGAGPECA